MAFEKFEGPFADAEMLGCRDVFCGQRLMLDLFEYQRGAPLEDSSPGTETTGEVSNRSHRIFPDLANYFRAAVCSKNSRSNAWIEEQGENQSPRTVQFLGTIGVDQRVCVRPEFGPLHSDSLHL